MFANAASIKDTMYSQTTTKKNLFKFKETIYGDNSL